MTGPRVITINFPTLPYQELKSNFRKNNFWGKRAQVAAIAREEAVLAARELKVSPPIVSCEVELVFTVPTRRLIDLDGMISGTKSWLDGICQAGVIENDDCWHIVKLSGRVEYRKGVEGTRIIITEKS